MKCQVRRSPQPHRPVRAALSRNLPCAGWYEWGGAWRGNGGFAGATPCDPVSLRAPTRIRQSRAIGRRVAEAMLRAGLTGRNDPRAGVPGFHPGLVELALQAAIAGGEGPLRVCTHQALTNLERHAASAYRLPCAFPVTKRFRFSGILGPHALAALAHLRPCCVCGL